jgi:hypothetical protein
MRFLWLTFALTLTTPAVATDAPSPTRVTFATRAPSPEEQRPPDVRVLSAIQNAGRVFVLIEEGGRLVVLDSAHDTPLYVDAGCGPGPAASLPCVRGPELEPASDGGAWLHATTKPTSSGTARILRWKIDENRELPPIELPSSVGQAVATFASGATVGVRGDGALWFVGAGRFAQLWNEESQAFTPIKPESGSFSRALSACFRGDGTLIVWNTKGKPSLAQTDLPAEHVRRDTDCTFNKTLRLDRTRTAQRSGSQISLGQRFYLDLQPREAKSLTTELATIKLMDRQPERAVGAVKSRAVASGEAVFAAHAAWAEDGSCVCVQGACSADTGRLRCATATYEGPFYAGVPHGVGVATVHGVRFGGVFEHGALVRGYRQESDGTLFAGTFTHGYPDAGRTAERSGRWFDVRPGEWAVRESRR